MPEFTVAEIAARISGRVEGEGQKRILGLAPLNLAGPDHLSFMLTTKYLAALSASRAGAFIVPEEAAIPGERPLIRVADPKLGMAKTAWLFIPEIRHPGRVLEGALVDPSAVVEAGATVYPLAVVGPGARVEEGAVIHPQAYVGPRARVGRGSVILPQAVLLYGVEVGRDCLIHSGAVLGADGFGFVTDQDGTQVKVPQVGTVRIGDKVEIGANTCIDRATLGATEIRSGVKVDNLVQIGHNCQVGENSIIVGQVGLSGSVTLGRNCVLAGQAGVADHVKIGDRAMILAKAGVMKDVPPRATVSGIPARPAMEQGRIVAGEAKLPELIRTVRGLQERLAALEQRLEGEKGK